MIAAINGAAAGVGLVLAAFADLRFAVAGAKFTTAHGRFNFPAEFGLSWVLPRIIGLTHENDVLLSSRVFTAEEAMSTGFLNKVMPADELMDHVMAYARNLADSVAPGSARETKHQIYRDLHRGAASAVVEAERLLETMIRHPDYGEGVKAWMEKGRAEWAGESARNDRTISRSPSAASSSTRPPSGSWSIIACTTWPSAGSVMAMKRPPPASRSPITRPRGALPL